VPTPTGAQIPLGELAAHQGGERPDGNQNRGAPCQRLVYVDIRDIDVGTYVQNAMRAVNESHRRGRIQLPPGYNLFWSGNTNTCCTPGNAWLMVLCRSTLLIISSSFI